MKNFIDAATITGARKTKDGYLVADVRCARTGCQTYHASELGVYGDGLMTVYRPEIAVFNKDSLATFAGKPVTVQHPPEMVTADNWKTYAVGDIGEEVARDGETVRVQIKLMDATAIAQIEGGTREISMGYTTPIEMKDGIAPDGTPYQAIQTGPIRINHLAIVDQARGGSQLRVGDNANDTGKDRATWGASPVSIMSNHKETAMSDALKTVVLGDKAVQVSATDTATIESFRDAQAKALADQKVEHDKEIAAKDAEIAKKDAEIKKMEDAKISDADLDKRVQDRADLIEKAKSVADDIKVEGLSDTDIRKAAVVAALGDEKAVEGKSEAYIDARFDALVEDAVKDSKADPLAKAIADSKPATDLNAAYADRNKSLQDAWKTPTKQEA